MADKNYYGKCGSCKFCDLGDTSYGWDSIAKFRCTKSWSSTYVFADKDPCNLYEPDRTRTNDMIERYERG